MINKQEFDTTGRLTRKCWEADYEQSSGCSYEEYIERCEEQETWLAVMEGRA